MKKNLIEIPSCEIGSITAISLMAPTEELLSYAREALQKSLPFSYVLPCGKEFIVEKIEDIPLKSVPCTCGDPRHWFVRVTVDPSLDS